NACDRVFISYSRKNSALVYPLADAMAEAGIDIWIDCEAIDPLDDFPDRIRDGLANSHVLLAWYSPEYAQSSYCQKELTAAWICTQRLTSDVLSRIIIVNPEEGVTHIALGDVARQNYLAAPKDVASMAHFIQSILSKLNSLSGDFSALRGFNSPGWYPTSRLCSSRFVGRLQELWRIHTALNPVGISDHEFPSVIAQLNGLGGIGKSLLATEYATRFGAAYPGGIHWLRGHGFDNQKPAKPEVLDREQQHQIADLAFLHEISIKDKEFREIRRDLGKKLATGGAYLWIVDDLSPGLEQQQGLSGWCAPSGNGHTLITTRSKEYAGIGITLEIDVLDPVAALDLLTQKRKPQTEQERQEAEALAEDLGRHALALDVAGYFLLEDKGFAALRTELASVKSDLLGEIVAGLEGQLPGGHEKSIVATLLQSVRLLKQEGLSLLRLACELKAGTPIPFKLVEKTFTHAFGLNEQDAENYRRRAMNQLKIHSLATVSLGGVGGDALLVHSLVRYTLLHGDPAKKMAKRTAINWICRVLDLMYGNKAQKEAKRLREKLREGALLALVDLLDEMTTIYNHANLELEIAHAKYLTLETCTKTEAVLSIKLGSFVGRCGNYREALAIVKNASPTITRVLAANHRLTLTTRNNIAVWTGRSGDAHEALRLLIELLPDQMQVFEADHHDTLSIRNNIAYWTGESGDAHEALRLYRELLPDKIRVLGADHPDTLLTLTSIAFRTSEIGEMREALRLSWELLPNLTRVQGADHPDTLSLLNNIATYTLLTGEVREALRIFGKVLPDLVRVLGDDHPDTLATRVSVALCAVVEPGGVRKALRILKGLLLDETRVLGADHPNTKKTLGIIKGLECQVHSHPSVKQSNGIESNRQTSPKIGRNEPCPCGSGLKYKRCHGNKR
ncbi:MAG: tetratricopeptide repeat protein, partial [Candidatus Methylumidiphilus sp.]